MALREFADAGGRLWTVWEVNPRATDALITPIAPRLRTSAEKSAWLAFECQSPPLRRRLTPYPTGWDELPDAELARLCEMATEVPVRRRLIE